MQKFSLSFLSHNRGGKSRRLLSSAGQEQPLQNVLLDLAGRRGTLFSPLNSSSFCSPDLFPNFKLHLQILSLFVNDAITIWLVLLSKRYKSPRFHCLHYHLSATIAGRKICFQGCEFSRTQQFPAAELPPAAGGSKCISPCSGPRRGARRDLRFSTESEGSPPSPAPVLALVNASGYFEPLSGCAPGRRGWKGGKDGSCPWQAPGGPQPVPPVPLP